MKHPEINQWPGQCITVRDGEKFVCACVLRGRAMQPAVEHQRWCLECLRVTTITEKRAAGYYG